MIGNYKVVAVCISRVHDTSCYEFVTKLNDRLKAAGYRMFIYNLCNEFYWDDSKNNVEASVFDLIDFDKIDAVVIMNEKIRDDEIIEKIIARANETDTPAVVVDGEYKDAVNLRFDYKKGFEDVVRHVVEHHGVKKVGFMTGSKGNPFAEERLEVFKKVIAENGIEFDESMVSYGNFSTEEARDAAENIVASGNIPDAIICANDVMAIATTTVLVKHGIKVPEQVIVTGFDGIDEIFYMTPQITSCICSYADMAHKVFDVVDSEFKGNKVPSDVLVSPKLILSQSCGCNDEVKEDENESLNNITNRFFQAQDDNRRMFKVVEDMENCSNWNSAAECLDSSEYEGVACLVNKTCTDRSKFILSMDMKQSFEDDLCLFYDDEGVKPFRPVPFKKTDVVPNLDKKLEDGYPLIFTELDFMGTTLGYLVFHFKVYNMIKYSKISLVATALRNAIGGFINVQYQHYLTEKMGELYKIDPQTKLYNRVGFEMEYEKLAEKVKNDGSDLTVIFTDLENLKDINDEFGYAAGDDAIHATAESFKDACPDGALCVHFGGSDLLAVIEGDVDVDSIRAKMEENIEEFDTEFKNPYKLKATVNTYKTNGNEDISVDTIVRATCKK